MENVKKFLVLDKFLPLLHTKTCVFILSTAGKLLYTDD